VRGRFLRARKERSKSVAESDRANGQRAEDACYRREGAPPGPHFGLADLPFVREDRGRCLGRDLRLIAVGAGDAGRFAAWRADILLVGGRVCVHSQGTSGVGCRATCSPSTCKLGVGGRPYEDGNPLSTAFFSERTIVPWGRPWPITGRGFAKADPCARPNAGNRRPDFGRPADPRAPPTASILTASCSGAIRGAMPQEEETL